LTTDIVLGKKNETLENKRKTLRREIGPEHVAGQTQTCFHVF